LKITDLNLQATPPLFGTPIGVTPLEFPKIFGIRKLKSLWAIVWHCLRDPRFSCLSRAPTCDRRTDRM